MADSRAPMFLIAGGPGQVRRRGADPLLETVLQRAGMKRPRVAYVGAASRDNRAFRLLIARMLVRAGAGEVTLAPMYGARVDPAVTRRVLEDADVVFVSGGDVEEGMKVVEKRGMHSLLRSLHDGGKPFLGVSAGSIMLAKRWVRWRDPQDDASAELFSCLGLAPVLCDTHGESEGWVELRAMLRLCRAGATGFGIVSGSALSVAGDGTLTALGGEVHVFRKKKTGVFQEESLKEGSII
ncbi:MAG: Type 1 glutamine amidotransferase-like domain-containing protein [Spirochaetia bacterium]